MKPPIIDRAVPREDREQFIRDNAVALVTKLERQLAARRKELKQFHNRVWQLRQLVKRMRQEEPRS